VRGLGGIKEKKDERGFTARKRDTYSLMGEGKEVSRRPLERGKRPFVRGRSDLRGLRSSDIREDIEV